MPAIVKFELRGAAELEKRLAELGPRVVKNVHARALRAMARPIVRKAKELVPVRTGALKKAITTSLRRPKGASQTIEIGYRPPTSRIAHLVEFGTAHSSAKPHMRPALDSEAQTALDEMSRVLWEGIEREATGKSSTVSQPVEGEG